MKRIETVALALLLLAFVGAGVVRAQEERSIELTMVAEQEVTVINEEGEEEVKRVPAARVVPGDEVIYTIYYRNLGEQTADNVVITNPVPEHMMYKDGSAGGEGTSITFSVDGGKIYDVPANLKVRDAEGKENPAKAADYTHIRWILNESLPPEAQGIVSFRAILE
jgi:uncharacterized repeat protein (TIGR01451 family)